MHFDNDIAMNYNFKRVKVLKEMRVLDGKATTYEAFLKDYLRSMAFTYRECGMKASKYKRIMMMFESVAKTQWNSLPEAK